MSRKFYRFPQPDMKSLESRPSYELLAAAVALNLIIIYFTNHYKVERTTSCSYISHLYGYI